MVISSSVLYLEVLVTTNGIAVYKYYPDIISSFERKKKAVLVWERVTQRKQIRTLLQSWPVELARFSNTNTDLAEAIRYSYFIFIFFFATCLNIT